MHLFRAEKLTVQQERIYMHVVEQSRCWPDLRQTCIRLNLNYLDSWLKRIYIFEHIYL